jgi:hypothetical protein
MNTRSSRITGLMAAVVTLPLTWSNAVAAPGVQEIIQKNGAARGGSAAWHDVKTLTVQGSLDAGGKPNHELPFVLRQKRPHESRLEILFKDQNSLQVYNGKQGWKVRPFLNRSDAEPFTPAESQLAAKADELDGPLLDYQAKGTKVALTGMEPVDGQPAYKLHLTARDGSQRDLWVDATSFLEVKLEGEPRKLDGRMRRVAIYFKDYRSEHGLNIAHRQDTVVEGVKEPYKMTISKVSVNESQDDALFQKPQLPVLAQQKP